MEVKLNENKKIIHKIGCLIIILIKILLLFKIYDDLN